MRTGKWYWENSVSLTGAFTPGIVDDSANSATDYVGKSLYGYGVFYDGSKYNNNIGVAGYMTGYASGDTVGVAFDADNGKLYFSRNGVWGNK